MEQKDNRFYKTKINLPHVIFPMVNEGETVLHVREKEIMKMLPSGDIYIKGKLATNNKEIMDGFREFLELLNKTED